MTTELATTTEMGAIERVIALGDLSKLTPEQRARYYLEVCASLSLNPLTRPFEYLTLNSKLVLYARKDATDQLRSLRRISLEITSRQTIGDLYVVTAKARTPDGRADEEIGAVSVKGLAGDALANALMKASTKAKRRVTLSVCGLGVLDESELETVRDAVPFEHPQRPTADELDASPRVAALPASMDPERVPQERLVEAEGVPDHPEYRRAVTAVRAAGALGMRAPEVPVKVVGSQVWTQIADDWTRAANSKRPAR